MRSLVLLVAASALIGSAGLCGVVWSELPPTCAALDLDPTGVALHQDGGVVHTWPTGWRETRNVALERAQVDGLVARLGAQLVSVHNQFLDVGGTALQVIRLTAADEAGAARVVEALGANGRERFVARRGLEVVEFAKMNVLAASALRHGLGFDDEAAAVWTVEFDAVCVDEHSDMEANSVFNLCLGRDESASVEEVDAQIAELTRDWRFGNTLRVAAPTAGFAIEYTFESEPIERSVVGDTLVFRFGPLPRAHGLPFVRARATVHVAPWYAAREGTTGVLKPVPAWPTEHATVRTILAQLVHDGSSERERLDVLFDYVARSVRYGGDVMGSRYGVEQVLEQGFGRCWDKSDVLVTLLRAAGLNAREVAGWLAAPGTGHVWVEAFVAGEGWVALDPTCTWQGVSRDYVPWFRTDDGHMPIVYVTMPRVALVP